MTKIINPYRFRDPNNPGVVDLSGYWGLEEDSGSTAFDSHGNNDGTNNNVILDQTGKVGKCYDFNGTTSYVAVPNSSSFDLDGNFSFSVWLNLNSLSNTSGGQILNKRNVSTPYEGFISFYEGRSAQANYRKFACAIIGAPLVVTTTLFNISTWYHIVVVKNGTNIKIYIDTSLEANYTDALQGVDVTNTNPLHIGVGRTASSSFINGRLDEIMWYKGILTQDNVIWLNNNGNGRSYLDL